CFTGHAAPHYLHSFPTRRSSDLFHNTRNSYVWGLDPNYLYSEDPDLFKLLQSIVDGKEENAGPIIKEKFGARFVFADAKENLDIDRKSTRLNSSHVKISYAVFCL